MLRIDFKSLMKFYMTNTFRKICKILMCLYYSESPNIRANFTSYNKTRNKFSYRPKSNRSIAKITGIHNWLFICLKNLLLPYFIVGQNSSLSRQLEFLESKNKNKGEIDKRKHSLRSNFIIENTGTRKAYNLVNF